MRSLIALRDGDVFDDTLHGFGRQWAAIGTTQPVRNHRRKHGLHVFGLHIGPLVHVRPGLRRALQCQASPRRQPVA